MDLLSSENPKLVSKIQIGKSYEGRPINILKVIHPMYLLTCNVLPSKPFLGAKFSGVASVEALGLP